MLRGRCWRHFRHLAPNRSQVAGAILFHKAGHVCLGKSNHWAVSCGKRLSHLLSSRAALGKRRGQQCRMIHAMSAIPYVLDCPQPCSRLAGTHMQKFSQYQAKTKSQEYSFTLRIQFSCAFLRIAPEIRNWIALGISFVFLESPFNFIMSM